MKKFINLIKELRKTERGKAILFFAFYAVFFIILFIILGINRNNTLTEKEYETSNDYLFDTSAISDNNYHFTYVITKDNVKYTYDGKRYGDTELITFNDKEYYFDGNKYYENKQEVSNPYIYPEFINFNNFLVLIEAATPDYKTDYKSGSSKYGFLIASDTINKLINNKKTDIGDNPNTIIVTSDEDNKVSEINYNLSNYCLKNNLCKSNLEIDLSYDQFGEIKEIVNN